jgi:hypothetical protein
MNWLRFLLVVAASVIVSSVTDWVFMGALFHAQFTAYPEVWRTGQSEVTKIVLSEVIAVPACAAFAYLLVRTGALNVGGALVTAVIVWVAVAAPVFATDVLWIKLHPLVGVSESLGWLARLVITGLFAAWLLKPAAPRASTA